MKIAIFSDIHAGFGSGTERESDAFEALKEALNKSLDCDLILIAGDIFDTKKPSAETFSRTIELLLKPILSGKGAKLVKGIGKDVKKLPPLSTLGIPVIAIHGNHERRARGLVNPVQSIERVGFLIYLHCNGVVFEKEGERVAVQGMSAVPDQFAEDVLKQWDPKPLDECFNILMFHQILAGFTPSKKALDVNQLPKGFDLYVSGDIHKPGKSSYDGRPLLVAGSLIPTQLEKNETEPKGVWKVDTKSSKLEFLRLENQRRFYFLEFERGERGEVEEKIKRLLEKEHDKKPIVRVKLKSDFEFDTELKTRFESDAIISFRKEPKIKQAEVKGPEERKISVQELGKKLLEENLSRSGLDPKVFNSIFEFLSEKEDEKALNYLEGVIEKTGEMGSGKQPQTKQDVEQTPEKQDIKVKAESAFEKTFRKIENRAEPSEKRGDVKKGKPKTLESFFKTERKQNDQK
jgi:DNA repair exonuclease SbcCD nuclease subunit